MLAIVVLVMAAVSARADEVPIAGVVKAVDVAMQTFIVESTAKGKTRQVTIHVKPTLHARHARHGSWRCE